MTRSMKSADPKQPTPRSVPAPSQRGVRRQRRGAAAVLFVALLMIILIIGAFAIDYAFMELAQTELRISTDLAARAASAQYGRNQNLRQAQNRAINMAYRNTVGGKRLQLNRSDIQPGRSSMGSDGKYRFKKGQKPYNSFRIVANMTNGSKSGPLNTFFQNFIYFNYVF